MGFKALEDIITESIEGAGAGGSTRTALDVEDLQGSVYRGKAAFAVFFGCPNSTGRYCARCMVCLNEK